MPDPAAAQPAGYHTIAAYLISRDAAAALQIYHKAFGGTELMRLMGPDGRIADAEMIFGDSRARPEQIPAPLMSF